MKILLRLVIIGIISVTVLAVIFLLLLMTPTGKVPENERIIITSNEISDILSITVNNVYGEYTFYYDYNESGFVTDDIPAFLVDINTFFDFMTNAANLQASNRIPIEELDLNITGLEDPTVMARIEFTDETVILFAIGDRETVSGNYYAIFGKPGEIGNPEYIYVLPQSVADYFLLPKTHIITRYVTPPLMTSSPLSAIHDITFEGGNLIQPVTILTTTTENRDIRLKALSFGTATHIIHSNSIFQLDNTYGILIFGSLFGITGDIVAYNLSKEEMDGYGFMSPYMTVEYTMINGEEPVLQHVVLKILEAGNNQFYITINDIGAIFLIERLPFIDIRYELLPLRYFLTPMLMNLSGIIIETQNRNFHFSIDAADIRNPVFKLDDTELDFDLFQAFFRLLTSAAHDGDYLGPLPYPDTGSILKVTYEYNDPDKAPDILTVFPGVSRRVNVFINGSGEFAMRELFVTRLLEAVDSLTHGNPVEENW